MQEKNIYVRVRFYSQIA